MTKLTLLLAQGPGSPNGDVHDRLIMNLCLNHQGQIDLPAYEAAPEPWLATRDSGSTAAHPLEIVRIDEGWALQSTDSADDPLYAFEGHVYRPGELVRLHQPNGDDLLYRIVASEAA